MKEPNGCPVRPKSENPRVGRSSRPEGSALEAGLQPDLTRSAEADLPSLRFAEPFLAPPPRGQYLGKSEKPTKPRSSPAGWGALRGANDFEGKQSLIL